MARIEPTQKAHKTPYKPSEETTPKGEQLLGRRVVEATGLALLGVTTIIFVALLAL